MKLRIKHSGKYLGLSEIIAVQNSTGENWVFCNEENEIDPKSGKYGRIVLKNSSNIMKCLQPSSIFPHNGSLIYLSLIQSGNDSQLWKFTLKKEDGFYVIENKNERKEKGKNIKIKKICLDVCEGKTQDEIKIIAYHIKILGNSSNQRWEIV